MELFVGTTLPTILRSKQEVSPTNQRLKSLKTISVQVNWHYVSDISGIKYVPFRPSGAPYVFNFEHFIANCQK